MWTTRPQTQILGSYVKTNSLLDATLLQIGWFLLREVHVHIPEGQASGLMEHAVLGPQLRDIGRSSHDPFKLIV